MKEVLLIRVTCGKGYCIAVFVFIIIVFQLLCPVICSEQLLIFGEDDKPFQYYDEEGNLAGMTIELVREIQRRLGNTDEIKIVPWARGLYAIDTLPNVMLFSMARTTERNELYQWIGPIAETEFGFYIRADSSLRINSLDDAKKVKLIGVYRGDIRDTYLTNAGFQNLVRSSDNVQNFKSLMMGRIDVYTDSLNSLKDTAERAGYKEDDVKLAYMFLRSQLYIAASKDMDPAIVEKWNTALQVMKKDGTFAKIFKSYFPFRKLPGAVNHNF